MTDEAMPRTKAGRRLLSDMHQTNWTDERPEPYAFALRSIRAIEAEATLSSPEVGVSAGLDVALLAQAIDLSGLGLIEGSDPPRPASDFAPAIAAEYAALARSGQEPTG